MNHPTNNDRFLEKESFEAQSLQQIDNPGNSGSGTNDNDVPVLEIDPKTQLVRVDDSSPTISVLWDRAVQQAVINTSPGPTIASRAYAMLHTAMFDAWAAYDPQAISTQLGDYLQRPSPEITEANKTEAMSYAAYRVSIDLFPQEAEIFDNLMVELGFEPHNTTTDTTTAAGVGNVSATALLEFRRQDGSNQLGDDPNGVLGVPYSSRSDYQAVNGPDEVIDIEYWTPERIPIDAKPGEEKRIQEFLTPQWGDIKSFALESGDQFRPEAPQPFLLVDGSVNLEDKTITLKDGFTVKIDRSLIGTIINPEFVAQTEEVIDISANLTDEQKLIAEFWEDGFGTSFPPGTWMTFGQLVSARDNNTLDQDAQMFFGLGNAVFDAGIATWEAKKFYDYNRPVRTVRELGELGLIGEFSEDKGAFVIDAWQPGKRTQTILATEFLTYQTPGEDPSPPFSEYTSGHSAFSAAGAEILELFTGSDEFGASVSFKPGESRFEAGITPSEVVTLDWDTFSEAADESGISRLYGGIHFTEGDLNGRDLGKQVGQTVWDKTQFFINGGEEGYSVTPQSVLINSGNDKPVIEVTDSPTLVFAGDKDELMNTSSSENLTEQNPSFAGEGKNQMIVGTVDRVIPNPENNVFNTGDFDDLLFGGVSNMPLGSSSVNQVFNQNEDEILFTANGNSTLTAENSSNSFLPTSTLFSENIAITDFETGTDIL